MKEDILEQLVDDYLKSKGYFTRHNVKYKPDRRDQGYSSKAHNNFSDIDVIGFNPKLSEHERVKAVNCKSWQAGFNPKDWIHAIKNGEEISGRPAWKPFRELADPVWSRSFVQEVVALTGQRKFVHVTAVSLLVGSESLWTNEPLFNQHMKADPNTVVTLEVLTLDEILNAVSQSTGKTLASSQVGRLIQVAKAAGWQMPLGDTKEKIRRGSATTNQPTLKGIQI